MKHLFYQLERSFSLTQQLYKINQQMGELIHTLHEHIVLIMRFLLIFTVIGFMPVPLFTFFGGDTLEQSQNNPLFEYFAHYKVPTEVILDNVYTNVYIDVKQKSIKRWDIDNAVLWADFLTHQLIEQDIPVLRKVISNDKPSQFQALQALHDQTVLSQFLDNRHLEQFLLYLKDKFQLLLPVQSITQEARQWIIIALNSDKKSVKKQLKYLTGKHPKDNFLVLSQTPISFGRKTFKIQLPKFNIKEAKTIISQALQVSQLQAQVLMIFHQKSLWSLNQANGNSQQFTMLSLLEQNFHNFDDISNKQSTILQEICKNGKSRVNKKRDLSQYGVNVKNKNYQWQSQKDELNYELQMGTLCGQHQWIDVQHKKPIRNNIDNIFNIDKIHDSDDINNFTTKDQETFLKVSQVNNTNYSNLEQTNKQNTVIQAKEQVNEPIAQHSLL